MAALAVLGFPLIPPALHAARGPRPQQPFGVFLRDVWAELETAIVQVLLEITLLAYHAYEMLRAIALTLVRMVITQRRLLEWETAAAGAVRAARLLARRGVRVFLAEMWAGPAAALLILLGVLPLRATALPVAMPFLAAWLASPAVAWWLSRPVPARRHLLVAADVGQLRRTARRTWHYFERLVTEQDHWLPPDNVQETPERRVAHRTSPTNIGMGLLSTLSAYDLGYLRAGQLADRIDGALTAVESLESYEGHLLNWYDTIDLAPLSPRYVSTVDSGNLAGALMTLAAGLRQLAEGPGDEERVCAGTSDTAEVLADSLTAISHRAHAPTSLRQGCGVALRQLGALRTALGSGEPAPRRLEDARLRAGPLREALDRVAAGAPPGPEADEATEWGRTLLDALALPPETAGQIDELRPRLHDLARR